MVWDSHPLALGATPSQVFIDGIPQLNRSDIIPKKADALQHSPNVPIFDKEAALAIKYNGLLPLVHSTLANMVIFGNLTSVWVRDGYGLKSILPSSASTGVVVVENGRIVCVEVNQTKCASYYRTRPDVLRVNLQGGSLSPALVSFGSNIGLQEIALEKSTVDGIVEDPLTPGSTLFRETGVIKAYDGLQYGTRDALWVFTKWLDFLLLM